MNTIFPATAYTPKFGMPKKKHHSDIDLMLDAAQRSMEKEAVAVVPNKTTILMAPSIAPGLVFSMREPGGHIVWGEQDVKKLKQNLITKKKDIFDGIPDGD